MKIKLFSQLTTTTICMCVLLFCQMTKAQVKYWQYRQNKDSEFNKQDSTDKKGESESKAQYNWFSHFWDNRVDENGSADKYITTYTDYFLSHKGGKSLKLSNGTSQTWTTIGPLSSSSGISAYANANIGRIASIWASATSSTVYTGSYNGGLFSKTGTGNWTYLTNNSTSNAPNMGVNDIAVDPTNAQKIVVGTGRNIGGGMTFESYSDLNWGMGVFISTDGGTTWTTPMVNNFSSLDLVIMKVCIDPVNTQIIYALSTTSLFKSTNGGTSWSQLSIPTLTSPDTYRQLVMDPNNHSSIYIATYINSNDASNSNSVIYNSTDGGTTWTSNLFKNVNSIYFNNNTNNCKSTLIAFQPGSSTLYLLIYLNNSSYLGSLLTSTDNGVTWNALFTNWNLSSSYYNYDFQPGSMAVTSSAVYFGMFSCFCFNKLNNTLYEIAFEHADTRSIVAYTTSPNNDVVYYGSDGGLMKGTVTNSSTNTTYSFADISNGLNISPVYRVSVSSDNQWLAFGEHDNGSSYSTNFNSSNPTWALLNWGDGGTTYIDQSKTSANLSTGDILTEANLTLSNQTGIYHLSRYNSPIEDNSSNHALYVTGSTSNQTPYLYTSTNYGKNWSSIYSITLYPTINPTYYNLPYANGQTSMVFQDAGYTSIGSAAHNTSILYAADYMVNFPTPPNPWNRFSMLLKFTNVNGTNPIGPPIDLTNNINDPIMISSGIISAICVDPSDENNLWICSTNLQAGKKVYHSADGGTTWTNISGNLPNFGCESMIFDAANQRLIVGMDVGIYFYNLMDKTWQLMNNGSLPPCFVTDLKLNVPTGDLYVATYGLGIFKTTLAGYCYNPLTPLTINSGTTWNTTQTICSDVIVNSSLTITADQVMPQNATITVNNGGILTVNAATVTNANIDVKSGGQLIVQNNGVFEINKLHNITVELGATSNLPQASVVLMAQ